MVENSIVLFGELYLLCTDCNISMKNYLICFFVKSICFDILLIVLNKTQSTTSVLLRIQCYMLEDNWHGSLIVNCGIMDGKIFK